MVWLVHVLKSQSREWCQHYIKQMHWPGLAYIHSIWELFLLYPLNDFFINIDLVKY